MAAAVLILASGGLSVSTAQAQDNVDAYAALLQQIADANTNLAQREFYVEQQRAQIERLNADLAAARSGEGQTDLLPMLRDMVDRLSDVMEEGLPIRQERRGTLIANLRDDVRADDASAYDGFRRAMELIVDEVELGMDVGSYTGFNPIPEKAGQRFTACLADKDSAKCDLSKEQAAVLQDREPGETQDILQDYFDNGQIPDGNYIHYGRLALLYLERDSSEGYRYNPDTKAWDALPASELLGLRQDVRIARGESAISTMVAPVVVGGSGATEGDAS